MDVFVLVRKTLDWGSAGSDDLIRQPRYRRAVAWWQSCCGLSYFEYRRRLKEIAQKSLCAAVSAARIIGPEELPRGARAVIVPVDDDDWMHPSIAEELADACGSASSAGVFWLHTSTNTWGRVRTIDPLELAARGRRYTRTNNYALCSSDPQRLPQKAWGVAHDAVDLIPPDNLLALRLSISNKTIGSWGVLRKLDSQAQFLERLRGIRPLVCPPELAWAEGLLSELNALNRRLVNSCKPGH